MTTPTQAQIEAAVGRKFRTFGGGIGSEYNPIAEALKDKPLQFAAGVSVAEVVSFVLTAAAGQARRDPLDEIQERYQKSAEEVITADKQREIERLRAAISYALLRSPWDSKPTKVQTLEKLRNALTAAAEVGEIPLTERERLDEHYNAAMAMNEKHRRLWVEECQKRPELIATTIERCAQVAEWFSNVEKFTAEDVAARIRSLKDKP